MTPRGIGYLAGRMTGVDGYNYDEFNSVAKLLRGRGFRLNNPAEHFGGDASLPRSAYIRQAVLTVLASDYVICLPGWETSQGASLEVDIAVELGCPIYEFDPVTQSIAQVMVTTRPARKAPEAHQPTGYPATKKLVSKIGW